MSAVAAGARPARSLAARNAIFLCALLPGLALLAWRGGDALAPRMLLALAAALVFETGALLLRRQPLAPFLGEGSAFSIAAVLVLYEPALEGWRLVASLLVALVLARQAFGGLARNLFHPVAVALVCAYALGVPVQGAHADPVLALGWLIGGLLLFALGTLRWQASAGLLLGALLGALAGLSPLRDLADPRWLLAACFIVTDPVTSPENARARFASAVAAGAVAALAGSANALAVLPFTLLACNAIVPWLDARVPARRAAAKP